MRLLYALLAMGLLLGLHAAADSLASTVETNVLPITVGCNYVNEPCVSVQVCKAGQAPGQCVIIDNILLDTGSSGLRVFNTAQVRALGLDKITTKDGATLAECYSYMDDSSDWGPVVQADVILGGETAANVRVQLIEAGFAGGPEKNGIKKSCPSPDRIPGKDYNGILGVGAILADCGPSCAKHGRNEIYYSCADGHCAGTKLNEDQQVSNPVAFLPEDSNGYAVQLQSIAASGEATARGVLILGIGTRANNTAHGLTVFKLDSDGNFTTNFNGVNYNGSFIDSGTSSLAFPKPKTLPTCAESDKNAAGYYCPSSTLEFTALQFDKDGTSAVIPFKIMNAHEALAVHKDNVAYDNIGDPDATEFDWGLPFFFGRTVYIGLEGKSSHLAAAGPYVAF